MEGFEHDTEADAAYIRFNDHPYAFGVDLDPDRRIDYDVGGEPIGVELLNVSAGVNVRDLPHARRVEHLLREHNIRIAQPAA